MMRIPVPEMGCRFRKGPMTEPRNDLAERTRSEEVLTLSEAAALLRVEEAALAELASQGTVPAQKIGAEWRFLKAALLQWLYYGPRFPDLIRLVPTFWHVEPVLADRLLSLLEQR